MLFITLIFLHRIALTLWQGYRLRLPWPLDIAAAAAAAFQLIYRRYDAGMQVAACSTRNYNK